MHVDGAVKYHDDPDHDDQDFDDDGTAGDNHVTLTEHPGQRRPTGPPR